MDMHTDNSALGTTEVRRRHIVLKAILVGVIAGALGAAFRLSLHLAERARLHAIEAVRGPWGLAVGVGIGIVGGALAVWLVRRFAPHAAGSGIPHLKGVLERETEPEWKRLLPVKFIGGVLGIGGGLALGREGPTVQMGGATGAMVSSLLRVKVGEGERRALMSAGAGAGLAAAFNSPLSGLIFVMEELHGNFTPVLFVAAFLASVSGDVVGRLMIDELPVFHLSGIAAPGVSSLPWAAVLGGVMGLFGVAFNRVLLGSMDLHDRLRHWPSWVLGGIAGGAIGLAAWFLPGLAGSGGHLVQAALAGKLTLVLVPVFVLARFGATMLSYASGAAGGIFAPLLVLGALAGLWFGAGVHWLVPSPGLTPAVFCVLGMGAMFTAVVRAPLTGIVLMVELTGTYGFMLPLLVSCMAAYGVAELLGNMPIYEALRERSLRPSR